MDPLDPLAQIRSDGLLPFFLGGGGGVSKLFLGGFLDHLFQRNWKITVHYLEHRVQVPGSLRIDVTMSDENRATNCPPAFLANHNT